MTYANWEGYLVPASRNALNLVIFPLSSNSWFLSVIYNDNHIEGHEAL